MEDVDADPEAVARSIALRRLTGAPQTRTQLARALQRRGVPAESAEAVLHRLEDVGLVDDSAYAEAWVESRHAGRGLARRALAHELRRRGVADDLVDEALQRLDPEQERLTARSLVDARLPATRRLDPLTRRRRLLGLLARKGYPGGLAMSVVREALAAEGPVGEHSLVENPVAQHSVAEDPVAEDPVAEHSVAEDPVAEGDPDLAPVDLPDGDDVRW